MDMIVRNGRVVTHQGAFVGDVGVEEGRISAIATGRLDAVARVEVDATGKLVFPGAIDCHAHLNDPGFGWREDFRHGTAAAAAGGVTTVVDMPLQNTPALTTDEILRRKRAAVGGKAIVDYAFLGGLVDCNLDALEGLKDAGVVGLKAFMGPVSPDYSTIGVDLARRALERTAPWGLVVAFHCEDYRTVTERQRQLVEAGRRDWRAYLDSRPLAAEIGSVRDIIGLAQETGARVHICHVSHPDVAEEIRQAQARGVAVTCETCMHYLVFDEDALIANGALFKCAPPLREVGASARLWDYVCDGTIQCIASDHSPCAPEEKLNPALNVWDAWGGISGIQTTFQVLYHEAVNRRGLDPVRLAMVLSRGPAQVFGLSGCKGALQIGADADFVVLDPARSWEITGDSLKYKNQVSAFVGLTGTGAVERTYSRGRLVYETGDVVGAAGDGRFVGRGC